MQLRLQAQSLRWASTVTSPFRLDIRNQGKANANYIPHVAFVEVQYDGRWYELAAPRDYNGPANVLPPGKTHRAVMAIDLKHGRASGWVTKKGRTPLKLTTGKHTIRVALEEVNTPGVKGGSRILSNTVRFEFAKPADAKPTDEESKPDDGFSKEVRGLRVKTHTVKKRYSIGDTIEVVFTFKNVSDREVVLFDANAKHPSDFHAFAFATTAGKRIAQISPQSPADDRGYRTLRIPPGKTRQHKVVLNHWKLAGLGTPYTNIGKQTRTIVVTGTYFTPVGLNTKGTVWHGSIPAKPLKIEIVKPTT